MLTDEFLALRFELRPLFRRQQALFDQLAITFAVILDALKLAATLVFAAAPARTVHIAGNNLHRHLLLILSEFYQSG